MLFKIKKYLYPLLFLMIIFFTTPLSAKERTIELNTTVDANDVKSIRLKNLPKSAYLSANIISNGKVDILLLDEINWKKQNDNRTAIFSSTVSDKLEFKIIIPHTSHYYLLLDNTKGKKERQLELEVTAGIDDKNKNLIQSEYQTLADKELQKIEQNLRRYFIFDDLNITIRKCGTANAFSSENTIIICQEIGARLIKQMNDKDKARDALLFAIMHEIGHVLLKQWGYPFYNNEEVADEFSTALLVMFNQGERARAQAEFFKKLSPDREIELKRNRDDRHPISVQRARNILKWLEDKELVKRWQKVFVPHFQTRILKKMKLSSKAWIDHKLVENELARREK